jgi:hypothetical protein
MKKLILVIGLIFLLASVAPAYDLSWGDLPGVDGYHVYWKELTAPSFTEIDVGTDITYDLTPLNLVIGTRYEFYVTAHSQGSLVGESDHLRWTRPDDPQIIEIQEVQKIILEFK